MSILLETSFGAFVVDLYTDYRKVTCKNFLKLCKMRYYNNCLFHSVQKGLVAQTGDPSGSSRGGTSVYGLLYGDQARYFDREKVPVIKHKKLGTLSMVNNGNDQLGSQFFITLNVDLDSLDKNHTVFGHISEGIEIIEKFNDVYCDAENQPFKNIRIHHTIVLYDPFPDPKSLNAPNTTPEYVPDIQLHTEPGVAPRIEEDEPLDDEEGLTAEEIAEKHADTAAKANARLLTLIGDIPDADIKPPDNVLFVCKLNSVTTAEDLEIIFSRFGQIKSCEVIRDKRTGNSLQYAFIEFEEEKSCEQAFFKMDNVVIDDRRIHVDFSQSVSKEWQKYRYGNGGYIPRIEVRSHRDRYSKRRRHHGSHHRHSSTSKSSKRHRSQTPKDRIREEHKQVPKSEEPKKDILDRLIEILETKTEKKHNSSSDSSSNSTSEKRKKSKKRKHERKHMKKNMI